ncbi:MAG: membrane protein insertion efficiency factor YidD [Bdellovibrionaceae bacterium]|nr:membrane protein insertion efficiency factor YidD [Pseudobdellovibrionaceae bacterium]
MKYFPLSLKKPYNTFKNSFTTKLSWICSFFIYFYRCFLSPYLGGACRFYPSCSEYAQQAFKKHTVFGALKLTFKRVFSCHPFGRSGYDPIQKGCSHE